MKYTKANFISIGKDLKGLVTSAVCLVVDTVSVPVSLAKDGRDAWISSKEKRLVKADQNTLDGEVKKPKAKENLSKNSKNSAQVKVMA